MKIACLGWGSLISHPGNLAIKGHWFENGPMLPIEFTRISNDGRLTLVITIDAEPMRVLWVLMNSESLKCSIESLRERENIPIEFVKNSISFVNVTDKTDDPLKNDIITWAKYYHIDSVIWTNLKPKNVQEGLITLEQALVYLNSLNKETKEIAENYIRNAPKQINTKFRRYFETQLGWTCNVNSMN